MLGLATAIAILAMLLAGPLSGLWSFYVTMRSIKHKLPELHQAEALKQEVGRLAPLQWDNPLAELVRCEKAIPAAEKALREFEEAVQNTREQNLPEDDGEELLERSKQLREKLGELRTTLRQIPKEMAGSASEGTDELFKLPRKRIETKVKDLEGAADDLRSLVRDHLNQQIHQSRRNYQVPFVILTPASVFGLLLLLSTLHPFYRWIFNPIRDLQNGVHRVAEGDFDHRIEVKSGDEMEELAAAFNDMTCRLRDLYRNMAQQINERSRQLVRSERLASVGFLAAGVAHEINNPLASIAFCSEALEARLAEMQDQLRLSLKEKNDFDVFAKYLKMIQEEAFRCKNITERLLEFSRGGERRRERVD